MGVIADSTLLGSNEYLIADGVKKKREGDKKPMIHPSNQKFNDNFELLGTTITLRYELVEQTNTVVNLQFQCKSLPQNFLMYKILRIREMGEFVTVFKSKRAKNDYVTGCRWDQLNIAMKEICRNDKRRSLRFEVYEWRRIKGLVYEILVCETDCTMELLEKNTGKYINLYSKGVGCGKLKIVEY